MKMLTKIIMLSLMMGMLMTSKLHAQDLITHDDLVDQLGVSKTRSLDPNANQAFGQNSGRANMSAIQFEYNSADLTDLGRKQVDELARAMKILSNETFHVIGHTDASGSDQYNLTLSQRRAKTVYDYLVEQHGIDQSRLTAIGKGESALFNTQDPNAADNRRVEAVNTKVLN